MKALKIAILAFVTVSALAADAPKQPDLPAGAQPHVGRYQLHSCTVQTAADGRIHESKRLFKIDTLTGATWEYVDAVDAGGRYRFGWAPLPTNVIAATKGRAPEK